MIGVTAVTVGDTLRSALRPRRSVVIAFVGLVGLLVLYYLQLVFDTPLPGLDALLAVVNAPITLLTRVIGPGVAPDAVGLLVFLAYYYLLAVVLAGVGRRAVEVVG